MKVNHEESRISVPKEKNLMQGDESNYERKKTARWSSQGILIF